jgi:biopolymer transport protein ExbB
MLSRRCQGFPVKLRSFFLAVIIGGGFGGPQFTSAQAPGEEPLLSQPANADSPQTAKLRGPQGFFEILFSGGPVGIVIMCVLIGMSLTMVYLAVDNAMSLRRGDLIPEELADSVRTLVQQGQVKEAIQLCRKEPSLLSFVLSHGMTEADGGWEDVEKALEDSLSEQSARLLRKIEYLSVLGNLGPMVGLLGTVVGMLMAFKEVASTEGRAGAAQLAEGIYQALVTTVVGLIIAIPALGAFAVLRNRVDQIMAEAAYAALHALAPLKSGRRGAKAPSAPPAPPPPPRTTSGGRG